MRYPQVRRPIFFSISFFVIGFLLLCAGLLSYAFLETNYYIHALKKFNTAQALGHAARANQIVDFFSIITLRLNDDIEGWRVGLSFGEDIADLESVVTQLSNSLAQTGEPLKLSTLITPLEKLHQKLSLFSEHVDDSLVLKHSITPQQTAQLNTATAALADVKPFIEALSHEKQTWVILLQNSDELRATGGFPGSYALVNFTNGVLEEIVIEDIYDADGQFMGFVEPPAGIREYTSSNKGLRLPDANWFPHYPDSAQSVLQFFALGNKRRIAGITSINLSVGKTLLEATGPIWLPDYSTQVSAQNLHEVLREERGEFFPGSIQKKHLLSQTITLSRQKVATLSPAQQLELVTKLLAHVSNKDIQAYAINPELQKTLQKYGITGEVGLHAGVTDLTAERCITNRCAVQPIHLYLVESNVGINKANRSISRSVELTPQTNNSLTAKIIFTNTAAVDSKTLLSPVVGELGNPKIALAKNGYANYQRLLINDSYRLKSLVINGRVETKIDQEIVQYETAGKLNQYGFLLIVLPQGQTTVEVTLEPTDSTYSLLDHPLFIQKQSGLPATAYTIYSGQPPINLLLEKDTLIPWK